jgi:hypothetical protein
MGAWLAPYRTYLEIAAALIVLGAFWWWSAHEKAMGEQRVKEKDAQIVAARIVHNREVESRAQIIAAEQVGELKTKLAQAPAADAPKLVCARVRSDTRSTDAVRKDAGPGPGLDAAAEQPGLVSRPSASYDFGPEIDKRFADDDALIKALQERIAAEAGVCR